MRSAALILVAVLLAGCSAKRQREDEEPDRAPAKAAPTPAPPKPTPEPPPEPPPEREIDPAERWLLRFRHSGAAEYVAQLAACGATVYIQDDEDRWWAYHDLRNPHGVAGDAAIATARSTFSAGYTAKQVAAVLKYPATPKQVKVAFPEWLRDEFARKELAHRNRPARDIKETIFLIVIGKDGKPVVTVAEQHYLR